VTTRRALEADDASCRVGTRLAVSADDRRHRSATHSTPEVLICADGDHPTPA
jgi:hypothetical protein